MPISLQCMPWCYLVQYQFWVAPRYDSKYDLVHGVSADDVAEALEQHIGEVDAVLLVSPTYHGVCSDIEAVAMVTHEFGARLIVDEAHGAHLAFHTLLPKSATDEHADIVIQSTHKTLMAMSQAAMMHVRRSSVDVRRIRTALQLVQSTSPNYLLLASLDGTRALMEEQGEELMFQTICLARNCAIRVANIEGFEVLGINGSGMGNTTSLLHDLDPTRVTVLLPTGIQGYDLDEYLIAHFGVYAELPSFRHLTFVFSPGNTQREVDVLVSALSAYEIQTHATSTPRLISKMTWSRNGTAGRTNGITPRQAFFADYAKVSMQEAIGCISVETLCPYPPGIPMIVAGERISRESVDILQAILKAGGSISGASDETLASIRVVAQ
ncbi:Orn/Lys/Arg decarboxylase [Gracilaria domingensis]|nr:Orn/Lys/Arg decarboxylase [Gracilaria domingensis]